MEVKSLRVTRLELEQHLSDRERAAELLRVQKRQLDTALNNMRHGLLLFDADRRVVVINRSRNGLSSCEFRATEPHPRRQPPLNRLRLRPAPT